MIIRKNFKKRVEFIKDVLKKSEASGNDSALVGILCKAACNDTVGIIMPCSTKRNYREDMEEL